MIFIQKYRFEIILTAVIVAFIAVFSHIAIERYKNLWSHYYDLGIMNQVVFNTSRGWLLEMTNQEFQRNLSRFAIHFDPLMIIFAPLYLIFPSPVVLLVGQIIFVSLGAIGVYALSLHLTKDKAAGLFLQLFIYVIFLYSAQFFLIFTQLFLPLHS